MPLQVAISPGQLREKVTFERRKPADDGYGNVQADWQSLWQCAARIMPLRGGEAVLGQRLAGKQPVVITVRSASALKDLTTGDRVVDARKGTVYNIGAISNPDEHGQYLEIVATAGVAT